MKIYRLEAKDGGGPFVTRDGYLRVNPKIKFNNNYIFGFITFNDLYNWLNKHNIHVENLYNLTLKIYDVPDEEVIIKNQGECIFPKKYSPINEKIKENFENG